jgi:hypothetical protein
MRREFMDQVGVNPKQPNCTGQAEQQSSDLRGMIQKFRYWPPMRVLEENSEFSYAEGRSPFIKDCVDIFRVEEPADLFGPGQARVHDYLKNRQRRAQSKVATREQIQMGIQNQNRNDIEYQDKAEQTLAADDSR